MPKNQLRRARGERLVFAVDLGGTHLRVALVDDSGKILQHLKQETPRGDSADEIIDALVSAAEKWGCDELPVIATSIMVPGAVDSEKAVVVQAPNLPSLTNFPLKAELQKRLGWPVFLENDANAAAVGEMWLGAARGCHDVVSVTLGTGVGGGVILNGKLWRGSHGSAGEIGHTTVDPFSGLKCKCGNTGCLELFASATAIVRMARELGMRESSAEKVYEAGRNGDAGWAVESRVRPYAIRESDLAAGDRRHGAVRGDRAHARPVTAVSHEDRPIRRRCHAERIREPRALASGVAVADRAIPGQHEDARRPVSRQRRRRFESFAAVGPPPERGAACCAEDRCCDACPGEHSRPATSRWSSVHGITLPSNPATGAWPDRSFCNLWKTRSMRASSSRTGHASRGIARRDASGCRRITDVCLALVTMVCMAACHRPAPGSPVLISDAHPTMGAEVQVTIRAVDAAAARAAIADVFAEFDRLDELLSVWKPQSDVLRVNASAGQGAVAVSADTIAVVEAALEASRLTDGRFDATFGALAEIWKFDHNRDNRVPSAADIEARLARVDYRAIEIDERAGTIALTRPGMRLHLGGIGKGYAVDRGAALIRARGLTDFMIQAGGDLYVAGQAGERPWRLGINDPRGGPNVTFAMVELRDRTLSTSGDYERFFIQDGVRYHHLLDPSTGHPARGCRSVSIVAPSALQADALSTGVFILGPEKGMALLERLPDVDGVIVTTDNQVRISSGLQGRVQIIRPPTE